MISNHPIWVAEADRVRALALPDEPVSSVLEIARTFGARYVVLDGTSGRVARAARHGPRRPLPGAGHASRRRRAPAGTTDFRVYRVACP